jgi:hypothetical protein
LFFGSPLFISLLPYNIRATPSTASKNPSHHYSPLPLLPLVSPSPPCCPLSLLPPPATDPTTLTPRRDGLASIARTTVAMTRGSGITTMAGGMDTRPGAAPSPPLLCLHLGDERSPPPPPLPSLSFCCRRVGSSSRRYLVQRNLDAAILVVSRDLYVAARRCNGTSRPAPEMAMAAAVVAVVAAAKRADPPPPVGG